MSSWDFRVSGYYHSGQLAIETVHIGKVSRDMELAALGRRDDIGRVEWVDIRHLEARP